VQGALLPSCLKILGVTDLPIIVNGDGIVLDGHHRFRACSELDIEPRTEIKRFADLLDEKTFVVECNLKRRHLNEMQRAEMGYVPEDIEHEKAVKNQEATIPVGGEKGFQPVLTANEVNIDPETGKKDYHETQTSNRIAKK
jgi:hypothetical protein